MFGKLFGRKASNVKDAVAKFENRDMLEATVGGAILVAYADGSLDASELKTLESILNANEKLAHFGSEIGTTIDRFNSLMLAGATLGRVKVMAEIRDCKNNEEEKVEIFATLIDIAQADGEIEEAELVILRLIGRELGISLGMFGLE